MSGGECEGFHGLGKGDRLESVMHLNDSSIHEVDANSELVVTM